MTASVTAHKKKAPRNLRVAILTVSTTRGLAEDKSGKWMADEAAREGHRVVFHDVAPDDADVIRNEAASIIENYRPHALLVSGGTGISPKDVTIEALRPIFEKEMTAFSAIFAQLSYEQIDSAAILSRAAAGIWENTVIFCMPGSLKACKLACKHIIFPELGHVTTHLQE
jgi:molybdopterin adenylyltransferase